MATRNPSLNLANMLRSGSSASASDASACDGAANAAANKKSAAAAANDNAAPPMPSPSALSGPRGDWWWTGPRPQDCPGWDASTGCLRSLPMPPTRGFTRQQLLDYFDNCWALTEALFASLEGEDAFLRQPYHQLRHPMMFYYVHPATLYVNKFRVAGLLTEGIDAYCEALFETGVDEMSWDDLSQARSDWPTVREAQAYRRKAYNVVRRVIETHACLEDGAAGIGEESPAWAVFMGFEHERIHLETSSVLIREVRVFRFSPRAAAGARPAAAPPPTATPHPLTPPDPLHPSPKTPPKTKKNTQNNHISSPSTASAAPSSGLHTTPRPTQTRPALLRPCPNPAPISRTTL
jgi:hypothetical protein